MSASDNTDKIVQDILNAKTLYDVLGVNPHDMDHSSLRKAYLKASVAVHPDKCGHPQATQAFQRVAEAWGTLSDDACRAEYDANLNQDSFGGGAFKNHNNDYRQYGNDNSAHYANDFERTHMPSFQEALFMFATVTSMFSSAAAAGGGGNATRSASAVNDFFETLFWAQQLAEGRNQGNGNTNNGNQARGAGDDFGNSSSSSNNNSNNPHSAVADDPLRAGMALGSGLRAIAGVQRAMGMRKSAAAMEKAAVGVQVAAMGATVMKKANENPAVQRTLERGQDALRNNPQLAKGLRASLKMAGSVIQSLHQAQQESQKQQQQQQHCSGRSDTQR